MTARTRTTRCPADHKHGTTSTCYTQHKCGCDACYDGWNTRSARREKLQAYGRYVSPYVDAAPAREHVTRLAAAGLTFEAIASLAGVHRSTIDALTIGRASRPRSEKLVRRVADSILAVRFTCDLDADDARVPGRGVIRRIQALVARGWSLSQIARQMGVTFQRVEQMAQSPRATAAVWRRAEAAYSALWNTTPPLETPAEKRAYSRSINRARRNGWVPPAAWDDIDTDPAPHLGGIDTGIDEIAVELAIAGERVNLNRAERHEVVKRLHALRWSDGRIADRIGVVAETIARDRDDLGLEAFPQNELLGRKAA
ncbi:hypothetical protein [Leifsonia sp. WHRI 6310E]|uniref:hypothetical protein n=1 Tax=Leifsonia sp. WHRI 6310E TaxID=3162562 RepID=UPI0035A84C1D